MLYHERLWSSKALRVLQCWLRLGNDAACGHALLRVTAGGRSRKHRLERVGWRSAAECDRCARRNTKARYHSTNTTNLPKIRPEVGRLISVLRPFVPSARASLLGTI